MNEANQPRRPAAERPLVSFLMTVHGTEDYLPDAVDSVLAQTVPHWELVVVDNGMSDAVVEVIGRYAADDRLRLVRQPNRGYAGGVMAAADAAAGAFFTVLDSDDLVMPDFVETVTDFVATHGTADAVGCDAHMFLDGEDRAHTSYFRSIGGRSARGSARRLTLRDVLEGTVPVYAGAVRREAWLRCRGYDLEASEVEEDVLLWLRLAAVGEVWLLPEQLVRCRVRSDSLSRDPRKVDDFEGRLINTFRQFAEATDDPDARAAARRPISRVSYHRSLRRAREALLSGDVPAARQHVREARGHRASLRALALATLLRVSPGVLVALHPWKQRLGGARRRVAAVLRPQGS